MKKGAASEAAPAGNKGVDLGQSQRESAIMVAV
jgi:hypothetical protein